MDNARAPDERPELSVAVKASMRAGTLPNDPSFSDFADYTSRWHSSKFPQSLAFIQTVLLDGFRLPLNH
jgi:hypothetical protein